MTPGRSPDPADSIGGALAAALGLGLVWSLEIATRFGADTGVLQTFVASFGCTAFTLGSVAVVVRHRGASSAGPRALVVASLLASGPIAILGALLREKTHHRPLGGVTFALIAAALVVLGLLVTRRALGAVPAGAPRTAPLRWVLGVAVAASVCVALRPLLMQLGGAGPRPGRPFAQDLVVGMALAAMVVVLPPWRPPPRATRGVILAWVLSVGVGVSTLLASMPLRAMLAAHAPVAAGALGLLGRARLPGEIPSAVDVSLH